MREDVEESSSSRSLRPVYRDTNLQIVFGVTLMAVLGVSSITPAFPKIVNELGISPQAVGYLIIVFTLPGVLLAPVFGVLADQYGRKKILVPALMIFALAGTACALVRDFGPLLLLRFFQGAAAAGLGAINVTILGDLYSGTELTAAMGCNSSVLSLGTASYPAIGGALATFGWYYPFILPVAAIPVGLAVLFSLKNPEPKKPQRFNQYFRDSWSIISTRQVLGLLCVSTLTFIIVYGSFLTYFPLLIGASFAVSPFIIGLIISASSLATALTSSQLGRIAAVYSQRTLITLACLLYAMALLVIPFVPSLWLFLIPTTIFGVAQGINMPTLTALLAGLAPMPQRGALMSINGMVLRLGQTLGPLTMGVFYGVAGPPGAFYAGVGFALIMFMLALIIIR